MYRKCFIVLSFVVTVVFGNINDEYASACSSTTECYCTCETGTYSANKFEMKMGSRDVDGSRKYFWTDNPCYPDNKDKGLKLCIESYQIKCAETCVSLYNTTYKIWIKGANEDGSTRSADLFINDFLADRVCGINSESTCCKNPDQCRWTTR